MERVEVVRIGGENRVVDLSRFVQPVRLLR